MEVQQFIKIYHSSKEIESNGGTVAMDIVDASSLFQHIQLSYKGNRNQATMC